MISPISRRKWSINQKFPGDALRIIRNANQWVAQFLNRDQERLLGLMVIAKYFRLSGQQVLLVRRGWVDAYNV